VVVQELVGPFPKRRAVVGHQVLDVEDGHVVVLESGNDLGQLRLARVGEDVLLNEWVMIVPALGAADVVRSPSLCWSEARDKVLT